MIVFLPWAKSESKLLELEDILNTLHLDIKFPMEYHNSQQPFLDVMVIKQGTKIETHINHKPTDSRQYLLFNSCHTKHTKTSIPYSLVRRICSIVTNEKLLKIHLNDLRIELTKTCIFF